MFKIESQFQLTYFKALLDMKISKELSSSISPCVHHPASVCIERCHVANVSIHEPREKMSLKGKNREWEREAHHYTVCQGGLLGRTASLCPLIGQLPPLWPLIGCLVTHHVEAPGLGSLSTSLNATLPARDLACSQCASLSHNNNKGCELTV